MSNNKDFSRREWLFVILIISIVQGWIWYTAFINAKSASALNYVSFAGTLISIILAVLAIGYTYGESVKQKNSGDTIANQINTLNDVIKNIEIEASSLSKISEISHELQMLSSSFNQGMKGIDATHKSVINLSSLLENSVGVKKESTINNENNISNDIEKSKLAMLFVGTESYLIIIGLLLLLIIKKKAVPIYIKDLGIFVSILFNYVEQTNKQFSGNDEKDKLDYSIILGGSANIIPLLARGKLIEMGAQLVISPELEDEIYKNIIKRPFSKGGDEMYKKIISNIISDIN